MNWTVRPLDGADIPACAAILAGLPDWFGLEQANAQYIKDLAVLPSFVALVDVELAGFLSLRHHTTESSEIHVLAVRRDLHRQGVGRALVERAEHEVSGARKLLQVKTLGPSMPDEGYARTRAFYRAMGFIPLEETTAFWGEQNPALIMVKPLPSA